MSKTTNTTDIPTKTETTEDPKTTRPLITVTTGIMTTTGITALQTTARTTEIPTTTGTKEIPTTKGTTDISKTKMTTKIPTNTVSTENPTTTWTTDLQTTTRTPKIPTTKVTTEIITTTGTKVIPTHTGKTEIPTSRQTTEIPTTGVTTEIGTNRRTTEIPTFIQTTDITTTTRITEQQINTETTYIPTTTVTKERVTTAGTTETMMTTQKTEIPTTELPIIHKTTETSTNTVTTEEPSITTKTKQIPTNTEISELQTTTGTKAIITTIGTSASKPTEIPTITETTEFSTVTTEIPTTTGTTQMSTTASTISTIGTTETTEIEQTTEFMCNNITVEMYTGPHNITCTIGTIYNFDRIIIISENQFEAIVHRNGSVIRMTNPDPNIKISWDRISTLFIAFWNISCDMNGIFSIFLSNKSNVDSEIPLSRISELNVTKRPGGIVNIKLNPDQISDLGYYRTDSLHSCEADIGNLTGSIHVDMLLSGEYSFIEQDVSNILTITDTTSNCTIKRNILFGINFTSKMEGAIVRCRVQNTEFSDTTLFSKNQSLTLIPHDICQHNYSTPLAHPTDCYKYVVCFNGNPFGKKCNSDLCFNAKYGYCDFCRNVMCTMETTTYEYTTSTVTTSTEQSYRSIEAMNCTSMSTFIDSGPASITCTFTLTADLLNITISRISNMNETLIATAGRDGDFQLFEPAKVDVRYTKIPYSAISLDVLNMMCEDEGDYMFIANQEGNLTFVGRGELIAKRKPSKPVLKVTHGTVVNSLSRYSTCTAKAGNPVGSINVYVKKEGDNVYREHAWFGTDIKTKKLECDTEIEFYFRETFSNEWNNTQVLCKVVNPETVNENENTTIYTSAEKSVILIPDDYCSGLFNKTIKYHPRGCSYFIECLQEQMYSYECPSTLCINAELKICDFCWNVDVTCNFGL